MNKLVGLIWAAALVLTLIFMVATLGFCGATIVSVCSDGEPSVSIAQYEPETTPDIYDV